MSGKAEYTNKMPESMRASLLDYVDIAYEETGKEKMDTLVDTVAQRVLETQFDDISYVLMS